jgi:hypothetical protein
MEYDIIDMFGSFPNYNDKGLSKKEMILGRDYSQFDLDYWFEYESYAKGKDYMKEMCNGNQFDVLNYSSYPPYLVQALDRLDAQIEELVFQFDSIVESNPNEKNLMIYKRDEFIRLFSYTMNYFHAALIVKYYENKYVGSDDYDDDVSVDDVVHPQDCYEIHEDVDNDEAYEFVIHENGKRQSDHGVELVFSLKQNSGVIPYEERKNRKVKHGQKKMLIAYLQFLLMQERVPKVICVIGASPGCAIFKISDYLNIRLIAIDNYPMPFYENNWYYTFDEVRGMDHLLNDKGCSHVFMDTYTQGVTLDPIMYEEWFHWVQKQKRKVQCSFKSFIPTSGGVLGVAGSSYMVMPFSSQNGTEVREVFTVDSRSALEYKSGFINSLRLFNQKVREKVATGYKRIQCNCYDCTHAEYIIQACSVKFGIRISDLMKYYRWIDAKRYERQSVIMNRVYECVKTDSYWNYSDIMNCDGDYVWSSSIQLGGNLSSSSIVHPLFDVDQYRVLLDQLAPQEERKVKYKKKSKPGGRRIVKGYKNLGVVGEIDLTLCNEVTASERSIVSGSYDIAIPRVHVTIIDGKEEWFEPVGSERTYRWSDVIKVPPCVVCSWSKDENLRVDFREYIASFNPLDFQCVRCSAKVRFTYYNR